MSFVGRGQPTENVLQLIPEAKVEHPVCLVDDQELDLSQVEDVSPHEVNQSPRCPDDHIGASFQCFFLPVKPLPAIYSSQA